MVFPIVSPKPFTIPSGGRGAYRLWVCLFMSAFLCSPLAAQEKEKKRKELPQPNRTETYKTVDGKSLKLFLFEPAKKASTPSAAIVFFFGGGWSSGTPEQFYPQARYLADRGMLAVCADYRVYSRDKALVVDCVADAQDAILYVRQQASKWNIDPGRIAAAGGSAGGHLAAATALLPYRGTATTKDAEFRPNALVLFNPALVLAPADDVNDREKWAAKAEQRKAQMGAKPEELSPYHHLTQSLPPTLILHGKDDTTVPYSTVEAFERKAHNLQAKCQLVGYPGQGHGFFNFARANSRYEETRDEMTKFLRALEWLTP